MAIGASHQLGLPAVDQIVEIFFGELADEIRLNLVHFLELHLQAADEQIGLVLRAHIDKAQLGEYVTVFGHCEQAVTALLNVLFKVRRPRLRSTAIVCDEHLSTRLQPLLERSE